MVQSSIYERQQLQPVWAVGDVSRAIKFQEERDVECYFSPVKAARGGPYYRS